jgi:hypothetical protein
MVLVKILGAIDLIAAIGFLMLIFGIDVFTQFLLFNAGLLGVKGMFAFTGDVLSFVDIFAAMILLLSILFSMPTILLWALAFLLIAKGFVSFL